MKRREFIAIAAIAASYPWIARAQRLNGPVIGFLGSGTFEATVRLRAAFAEGLGGYGYVEGRNCSFEYRWAEGRYDRLAELAADLVARDVALIVAAVAGPTALAAKAATKTIPIVFLIGADPVAIGLVASLNRPGGNATGVTSIAGEIAPKRLAFLKQLVPGARRVVVIANPANHSQFNESIAPEGSFAKAAASLGLQMNVINASSGGDIDSAFATMSKTGVDACFVAPDAFFLNQHSQFAELAAREKIPASMELREFVEKGGLMSYGPDLANQWRLCGDYVARILSGKAPSELPVQQSSKFEFVINRKAAIALGIDIPPTLLAIADEVLE